MAFVKFDCSSQFTIRNLRRAAGTAGAKAARKLATPPSGDSKGRAASCKIDEAATW